MSEEAKVPTDEITLIEEDDVDDEREEEKYRLISNLMVGLEDAGMEIKDDTETTKTFVFGDVIGHTCYVNKCNAPLLWHVSVNGDLRIACQKHKGKHNILWKKIQEAWITNYYQSIAVNNTFLVRLYFICKKKNTQK